jgi:thioredoxin-dependent peroxiredoxin
MALFSGTHLAPGSEAPDFTLPDQDGNLVTLSKLRGKKVVLYFYPKADTPGCTAEACSFRDQMPDFPKNALILGMSKDSVASQKSFAKKFRVNFPLLADQDGDVIRKYGVDFLFGFAKRKTFLIGTDGKVARIFESVSPAKHAAEVREALAAIG